MYSFADRGATNFGANAPRKLSPIILEPHGLMVTLLQAFISPNFVKSTVLGSHTHSCANMGGRNWKNQPDQITLIGTTCHPCGMKLSKSTCMSSLNNGVCTAGNHVSKNINCRKNSTCNIRQCCFDIVECYKLNSFDS